MKETDLQTYIKAGLPLDKKTVTYDIAEQLTRSGYSIVEINTEKPWGTYIRIRNDQADKFVNEFFPGLSAEEARLGQDRAELSPKILIVAPGQRLSWQYHDRRAERWMFLTKGAYNKSADNDEGGLNHAKPGDVIQFACAERHRLNGIADGYVIVAEIWQHTDNKQPSDEDDIVRLQDDYAR